MVFNLVLLINNAKVRIYLPVNKENSLADQKVTYFGMPFGMWTMFAGSFQKQLTVVFGYDVDTAKTITKKAKPKYREIISELPEFEKGDRFKMNLVNCAMIGAFILSMPERPKEDRLTDYYATVSYTHLDVYKRQEVDGDHRRHDHLPGH